MDTESQLTHRIIMVRPANFIYNAETAINNTFQQNMQGISPELISNKAIQEFDKMVLQMQKQGIEIFVVQDTLDPAKPDAIFPNNWFTTHQDGTLITYPMFSPLRRLERREDVLEDFERRFKVKRRFSLEMFETYNQFLEGTGSMVLDRVNRIVYACISPRTDVQVLSKFSLLMSYEHVFFSATDQNNVPIYHTNVLMTVGEDFVICCLEAIEAGKRNELLDKFSKTLKDVIEISFSQMERFAGNMIELRTKFGAKLLVMSQTAYDSLNPAQISVLEEKAMLCIVDIPTIEKIGGGSARCMIAENFLSPNAANNKISLGLSNL